MADRRGRHSAGRKRRGSPLPASPKGRRSAGPRKLAPVRPPRPTPQRQAPPRRRKTFRLPSFPGRGAIVVAGGALLLVLAVIVAMNVLVDSDGNDPGEDRTPSTATTSGEQTTYLLVGTESSRSGPEARWMTLIEVDASASEASIAYLPAHTGYEVPGYGLQGIGEVLDTGGISLISVSVENMLGIPIDHFIELPATEAEALVSRPICSTRSAWRETRLTWARGISRSGSPSSRLIRPIPRASNPRSKRRRERWIPRIQPQQSRPPF
jgi:hypothetical protein